MAQRERKQRITKEEWRALGGLTNSDLFRVQKKGGAGWRGRYVDHVRHIGKRL